MTETDPAATTTVPGDPATEPQSTSSTAGRYLREAVTAPLDGLRRVAPDSPVPVALAAGALAVGGVIDWPVAGAIGLGYLALRRWR